MTTSEVAAGDIEQAWMRCAQANPTTPPEYAMCADAARIADVYARVLMLNLQAVDLQTLRAETRDALMRWLPTERSNP